MMMKRLSGIALLLCVSISPAAAQSSDRDQVMETINSFLKGMLTKDSTLMAAQLDSTTRMTLLRPIQGQPGVRVWPLTGKQFMEIALRPNQPALDEPIRNPVVHVDADLAHVWAEYQVRRDGKVTHCGFDSFQLARLGGKWKIINISDTFRTTGCGEMWK